MSQSPITTPHLKILIAILFTLLACGPLATAAPRSNSTSASTHSDATASCENVPAQFANKKSPYSFDDPAALAAGKQTYDNVCSACHGPNGRGDGPASAALNPKPANFADKAFMASLPIDCHFWKISEGGGPGSPMPAWRTLGEAVIWQVLIYERSVAGAR